MPNHELLSNFVTITKKVMGLKWIVIAREALGSERDFFKRSYMATKYQLNRLK